MAVALQRRHLLVLLAMLAVRNPLALPLCLWLNLKALLLSNLDSYRMGAVVLAVLYILGSCCLGAARLGLELKLHLLEPLLHLLLVLNQLLFQQLQEDSYRKDVVGLAVHPLHGQWV